jgi:hypothetical protein
MRIHETALMICPRLVDNLGLKSTLTEYKVPREDAPKVAEQSLGGKGRPEFNEIVQLLEKLY